MKYTIESAPLCRAKSDVVVVGVFQGEEIEQALRSLDPSLARQRKEFLAHVSAAAKEDSFTGKAGKVLSLPTYGNAASKRLIIVGLGKKNDFNSTALRKLGGNLAKRLCSNEKLATICFFLGAGDGGANGAGSATGLQYGLSPEGKDVKALIEGWILGSFAFQKYKSAKDEGKRADVSEIRIGGWKGSEADFKKSCNMAQTIASATNFARSLIAEPASYMTPSKLAQEAQRISKEHGLTCKVIDVAEAEKLGMGSFLGVARGAAEPAKFVTLKYAVPGSKRTVAVVGKGITFDSGGLSLKPAQSMEHMKYDMSGAAAVLATMQVVGTLKPGVSVLGVLASAENMPGDAAMHPGDVLKAMNGKTIEVNNTDAEGRLVLADALTYACRQGADELIDIATLTGAIVTALGRCAAGVMGSDQKLVDGLLKASDEAGEKLWQMPLFDEYKDGLKSDIADLKNAGSRGEAGSSSAGMFLKEFIEGGKPWAHLDIAGPGWLEKERDEMNKGGTAFGVRTICHYILGHDANGAAAVKRAKPGKGKGKGKGKAR